MKQVKRLMVEVAGKVIPVTVTIDAPLELVEEYFIDNRMLLRAAADEQNMLVRSRHHTDRDVRIFAKSTTTAEVTEAPRLRLVA